MQTDGEAEMCTRISLLVFVVLCWQVHNEVAAHARAQTSPEGPPNLHIGRPPPSYHLYSSASHRGLHKNAFQNGRHKTGVAPPERQTQGKASGLTFLAENKAAVMEPHVRIIDNPRGYRHGGTPRPSAIRRLQNRKESEEATNRKECDEAHNREESEEAPNRKESGEAHNRQESEEAYSREESGEAHNRQESGEAHSREESGEAHSREESEEAHSREESGEAHNREESEEAHSREESGEAHSREESEEAQNREESEEAHSREESGEAHNREESDEAHNREEESDEAHNSSASFNCRKNKDSIQKPHKTQTELDELRTGQDKGEVRHAESTLHWGKAAAVLTDKEVRKVTKTNGTFPQVRKTGHRSGGVLLVRETTNNLGYKRIGEVSTVRMPHPYRYAGTKSWDPVLMEAVLRWMSNGTKRNRLKRIRRQSPDGDELVVRTPVGKSSCKCETCSSNSAAYTTQQYENVAFNKKTITSSVYKDSYTQSLGGCGAVNGNTGHRWVPKSKPGANCFHTRDDDPAAWWTVDLMYVFTLRNMTLFRRGGQGGAANLAATLISIDYQTCYHFTLSRDEKRIVEQTRNLKEKLTVTCTRVVTGRVIRFEKIPHVLTPLSKNLDVCELQIWVCKMGTYGVYPGPCKPCPTQCKYTCNNYYGCDEQVLHNVAIHKRVTLSSSDGTLGKLGTVITDGATTKIDSSGCVKTRSSSKKIVHWVEVQLVTTFRIIYATLRARLDCCSENELRLFYLVVTDEHSVSYPPNDKHVCQYHPKFITTRTYERIDCKSPRDGRFFTIMKKDTHSLSVCEVQIYGHHRYRLSFGARCMSISETAVCAGGMVCSKGQCKMKVQEPCKRNEDCREGAVCDIRKCKYDINGRCQPNKNECKSGTVCDPTSKTCKLSLNSQCSSGQCMTNTVCDALHFCKRNVGQQCDKSQECTAGAMCEQKKCVCDTHVSTQNADQCDPVRGRIGSACQKPGDCKVVRSLCQNNVCVCKAEYSTFAENFSCKLKAGSSCSKDSDCNTGLQCEDGKCKLDIGDNCFGNEQFCTARTTCEQKTCRLTTGQRCADHQDLCVSGHRCSAGFCKIQLGEDCEDAKDECVSGKCFAQDSYTCRLDAGQNCTSDRQQSLCRSGTVCEYGLVCKVTIGNPCSDTSTCQLGAVCGVRQGSSDKKCRKPAGSSDCSKDDDCVDTTVCDHQKNCRIAKSGDCKNRPGLCLTGSTCTGGTCQCNHEVTDTRSAKCDPRPRQVGGQCGSSGDTGECQDPGAMCGQDNTCHCDSTFAANHPDLHCRINSGFPCSLNESSTPCISGAKCVKDQCLLDTGEVCIGSRRGYCKLGAVCDLDGFCRLNLHQNCSGDTSNCEQSTVCDSVERCKLKPGAFCRSDGDCMAGAHCENGICVCTETVSKLVQGICDIKDGMVGGACEDSGCSDTLAICHPDLHRCHCQAGYATDARRLSCAKAVGAGCSKDSECTDGKICDDASKQCKIPLGLMCDGVYEHFCRDGTVCDFDYICKLDLKGNCSGENSVFCRSGTFCDILEQCSQGVGDSCNVTQTCVAGATCIESLCICETDFSSQNGAICEPISGRYGAPCDTEQDCQVDNSICIDEVCVCQPGYRPRPDFTCESESEAVKEGKGVLIGILAGVAAILVAVGMVIAFKICQQRREQELKKDDENEGDLSELKDQVHDLESEQDDDASATTATENDEDAETELESSVAESTV